MTVPRPAALITFDHEKKEINSSILLVGSRALECLEHVRATSSSKARFIDATVPGEPSYHYLPLTLGEVRGFQTRFHLYAFGSDVRLTPLLEEIVLQVSAVVVAEGDDRSGELVHVAARQLEKSRRAPPVAALAPQALSREWTRRTGSAPLFEAAMSKEAVFPALKVLAKQILMDLRDGAPERKRRPWWRFW